MVDYARHELLKQCYELAGAINAIPASAEQTTASILCSALAEAIDAHLDSDDNFLRAVQEDLSPTFMSEPVVVHNVQAQRPEAASPPKGRAGAAGSAAGDTEKGD